MVALSWHRLDSLPAFEAFALALCASGTLREGRTLMLSPAVAIQLLLASLVGCARYPSTRISQQTTMPSDLSRIAHGFLSFLVIIIVSLVIAFTKAMDSVHLDNKHRGLILL